MRIGQKTTSKKKIIKNKKFFQKSIDKIKTLSYNKNVLDKSNKICYNSIGEIIVFKYYITRH